MALGDLRGRPRCARLAARRFHSAQSSSSRVGGHESTKSRSSRGAGARAAVSSTGCGQLRQTRGARALQDRRRPQGVGINAAGERGRGGNARIATCCDTGF